MRRYIFFAVAVMLSAQLLLSCVPAPQAFEQSEFIMDTVVTIRAYGKRAPQAVQAAFAEMRKIEALASAYISGSDVWKVNNSPGQMIEVSADTLAIIQLAQQVSEQTDGAFDISVFPLVQLWGIGKKDEYVPTESEVAAVVASVDFRKIRIDADKLLVGIPEGGMGIDLGGVAKGYAADRAAAVLAEHGIKHALINAGGNVVVMGGKPDGSLWRVGIQDPRDPNGYIAVVRMNTGTVVTSGDYERYFIKDGKRYHHIFDPRTGQPAAAGVIAVSVTAPTSAQADAYSTALFVMGVDKGMKLVESLPDIEAIFVTEDGEIVVSSDFPDIKLQR
ncbi:MAG: FAD:protein FMN transferase [Bacillota bacterium]